MRYVSEDALEAIAIGSAILGTGGGGDPHLGTVIARSALRKHGPVQVVSMDEVADDAFIVPVAAIGAPTVHVEVIPSADVMNAAVAGISDLVGKKPTHTLAVEVGGINSLLPFAIAGELGLPVIDGDMMGRAFPEIQMALPSFLGIPASPMAMGDEHGNSVVLSTVDNDSAERLARAVCMEMGSSSLMALYTMSGAQARGSIVRDSLALCEQLGRGVQAARAERSSPVDFIVQTLNGRKLFVGKVTDVGRRTERGFAMMASTIDGLGDDSGSTCSIRSQNEHLVAYRDGNVLATTPDLIILLDSETGEPITTEALRYGMRVTLIGAPCDVRYRSEAGLAVVGPRAFGYDIEYRPVELIDHASGTGDAEPALREREIVDVDL